MGIVVSIISSFASNLWNHSNDVNEDIAQGKKTVLTQNYVSYKTTVVLSIALYIISIISVLYLSILLIKPIYYFFLPWSIITWWYSDSIFLRKIFGFRLKTHYFGEIITYGIACPSYTLSIWLIYSDLNYQGIAVALAFSFLGISGVLLKDIKDISGDRKAGLRTLGVIFTPSKLLQASSIFLILYYFTILDLISLKILKLGMLLVIIPFIWFIKDTFFYFHKKCWELEVKDIKSIQIMMKSTYISVILLGIGAFI